MPRNLRLFLVLALLAPCPAAAGENRFPRPAALEPQIRFWTRVYSEVDRDGGFIHDSVNLDVVYEAVRLPGGLSRRSRERQVERAKKRYEVALRKLARGKRSGLSDEEARVLALWPEGVSNATLSSAARRVRFQLGQADRFREGLVRAGRWADHIAAVLHRHGVPPELSALPHVESSYNPIAYSRVGAAGLWQFTRSTGRLFMRVDNVVDERMDPDAASEGAARLLRANYDALRSWPLAITAYNHGVGGMKRAIRKVGTDDIAAIVAKYKSRSFGFASRNFYTEFLAAVDVERNSAHFFGPLNPDSPIAYETIQIDQFYPVAAIERALGIDGAILREHNRSLRPSVWNGAKYVPKGFRLRVPASAVVTPLADAMASIPAPQRFAKQHRDRLYKVRRGDTLSKIARRYHVKERVLVDLNNLRSRHRIRIGQVLTLPDEPGARAPISVARAKPPSDGIYRVRRGDTISMIAARFGTTETLLVAQNGLRNRNRIAVGQRLQLPIRPSASKPAPVRTAAKSSESAVVARTSANVQPPRPVGRDSADGVGSERSPTPPPRDEPALAEKPAAQPAAASGEPDAPSAAVVVTAPTQSNQPIAAAERRDPLRASEAAESREEPVRESAAVIPAPDPSDYAVTSAGLITVQAAETLGHYADWLEIPTSQLRRLNRLRYGTPIVIGREAQLDLSRVGPEVFEQRRLEYHHALQEEFFAAFEVVGTDDYVLRRGDTLWYLAEERHRVPVWLLRQYNPTLDFGALQVGTRMLIPRITERDS